MPKSAIHPNYQLSTVTCACGASYETASTRGNFGVEICAKCHPFYTGRQKLIDAAGRIERFQRRYGRKTAEVQPEAAAAQPEAARSEAAKA